MNRQFAIKLALLLLVLVSCDQKRKYWVYFDTGGKKSPLNAWATQWGDSSDCYCSAWLEACAVLLTSTEAAIIARQSQVDRVELMGYVYPLRYRDYKPVLSFGLEQIEAKHLIEKGLTGKGVKVGIIDGGFLAANEKEALVHVFDQDKVMAHVDYITPDMPPYGGSVAADDAHGTDVWEQIAGIHAERQVQYGLAPEAEFYLARTDDGRKEYRMEEEYLIRALEWMHDQGVKLVNISLGYSNGYDNPDQNYKPKQMDGKSTAVTRAAQVASEEKGMLLVVAAGNDGDTPFEVLSAPADARGVLSVGATHYKHWQKAGYSAVGTPSLPYVKPNVACFSFNGTSFSAPIITGVAACLWQMDSTLTHHEIISMIEKSGHLYPFANNYIGYGVPSCKKLIQQMDSTFLPANHQRVWSAKKKIKLQPNSASGTAVVFHKKDTIQVKLQERLSFADGQLEVNQYKDARYTTVATQEQVWEIEWQ